MQKNSVTAKHRLLIIDDNSTIHEDIKKILCPASEDAATRELAEELFGDQPKPVERTQFQIDSAFQGQEGLAKVKATLNEGKPYSLAFVDVRMPPGWDGIETIRRIWEIYPELQFIICTAYSDNSWEDIIVQLGHSDSLVILKKPFDNVEVLQLAHALTSKWDLARENRQRMNRLDEMVIVQTAALSEAHGQLQSEIARRAGIEAALRASEERFQKAFQAATVPMAILHLQTQQCIEVNDNFVELVGQTRADLLSHAAGELILSANPAGTEQLLGMLRANKHVRNHPCLIRRPDGDVRETVLSLEPVVMGGEACMLIAMQDDTELHKLEAHLRQAQKNGGHRPARRQRRPWTRSKTPSGLTKASTSSPNPSPPSGCIKSSNSDLRAAGTECPQPKRRTALDAHGVLAFFKSSYHDTLIFNLISGAACISCCACRTTPNFCARPFMNASSSLTARWARPFEPTGSVRRKFAANASRTPRKTSRTTAICIR